MKRARFLSGGRYHEGYLAEPGVLVDEGGRPHREDDVVFLPPVEPRKVIGLALNYADHAAELSLAVPDEPALFFKPPNTWVGHRAPVVVPAGAGFVHYEIELAVVIGRRCRRVAPEQAGDVVAGYTIANDVTVRDFITNVYRPPVKAKGWDTFGPLGPYLVEGEVADPHALGMRVYVNGQLRQQGHTSQMLRRIPDLIAYLSEFMTLEPGDVILTGTPRGISPVQPGDVMRLEIDGLGALENPVVAETGPMGPTPGRSPGGGDRG
ncbi:5-carboxy-2-oxohept-3-enedioate decarboxylase HpaG2 subunit [Thermaerobacter marianensis DSM 12885]|uniref:5-carboxy-2-oxohept-3-enedioate decarboxylase HpaG2 subunit n=1 Tax=Thermaerobacter marianensis (strain ATCC 700841 / DSM 12885 / JCM 10246 / 7p75a) TaxID=644966 RepID=E6SIB0_THEM7|nr:fumarylacetoacetate hydrolase family protein [Thermaerobacter marianensis]ADU51921.1 5-carboxy-2-oxohept-3-enedioate decarboxylase HpaG2 subunit [Thermaerobacter marianensis DSM 12885]